MREEALKDLERVCSKVIEKFPEIKEGDISVEYYSVIQGHAYMLMIDPFKFHDEKKVVVNPKIVIGEEFLESSEQEKEAMLAHELGHYCRLRNQNINKIRRHAEMKQRLKLLDRHGYEPDHKAKRLLKWNMLDEVYADRRAAEAGYGEGLVRFLEKIYSQYSNILNKSQKEEAEARIKNLKALLGEKT